MSTPRPDWYADPTDSAIQRWWNGRAWSYQTRTAARSGRVAALSGRVAAAKPGVTETTASPSGRVAAAKPGVTDTTAPPTPNFTVPDILEGLWDSFNPALLTGLYGMTNPKPLEASVR